MGADPFIWPSGNFTGKTRKITFLPHPRHRNTWTNLQSYTPVCTPRCTEGLKPLKFLRAPTMRWLRCLIGRLKNLVRPLSVMRKGKKKKRRNIRLRGPLKNNERRKRLGIPILRKNRQEKPRAQLSESKFLDRRLR